MADSKATGSFPALKLTVSLRRPSCACNRDDRLLKNRRPTTSAPGSNAAAVLPDRGRGREGAPRVRTRRRALRGRDRLRRSVGGAQADDAIRPDPAPHHRRRRADHAERRNAAVRRLRGRRRPASTLFPSLTRVSFLCSTGFEPRYAAKLGGLEPTDMAMALKVGAAPVGVCSLVWSSSLLRRRAMGCARPIAVGFQP